MKESATVAIPPVDQVETLSKPDLDRVLAVMCEKLYVLMDQDTYARLVLREVKLLSRGLHNFIEFVKKMIALLVDWQQPRVVAIR